MRKRLLAIIATAALVVTMIPSMVFADDAVAKIGDVKYASMEAAISAVPTDGTEKTIELQKDYTGNGIVVKTGQNVVIDLNECVWDITGLVGSTGTETSGMQLLKDSKVTIKNGTITSETAKLLIQNYSDLTLENVTLDGSYLPEKAYTLSNNAGNVTIGDGTIIYAPENGYAFDVYFWPSGGYSNGPVVTIEEGSEIYGDIECASDGSDRNNSKLIIEGGIIEGNVYVEDPNVITADDDSTTGVIKIAYAEFDNDGNVVGIYYDIYTYDKSVFAKADDCAIYQGARYKDADGIYYYYEIPGESADRIANSVWFYKADQNGNIIHEKFNDEDGEYDIWWYDFSSYEVASDETIKAAIDKNDNYRKIEQYEEEYMYKEPTLKGYKFVGWYTAEELIEDSNGDVKSIKYGKKVELTDKVDQQLVNPDYDELMLFPKWEKVTAVPEKSPNTGDNSVAPFAIAGLALAAMAAVAATRRRTN